MLSKQFQKKIPGAQKDPRFWASGISVVMHMKNPLIPAMHFNTRYICTTQEWFGGGMDITPCLDFKSLDSYHDGLEKICNGYDPKKYLEFKKWCDDYTCVVCSIYRFISMEKQGTNFVSYFFLS